MSSCSQPLQEPASTWRIASDRRAVGAARSMLAGGGGAGRGAGRTSAVRAGVAELEALVDQREVGHQVAGRRRARARASSRRSRCADAAGATRRRLARRRRSSRRAGSRCGATARPRGGRRRCRRPGTSGAASRSSSRSKVWRSSSVALLEARADVAGRRGRSRRREAVVGEPAVAGRCARRRRCRRARAAGPTAPSAAASSRAERRRRPTRRSWNDALNASSRQAAARLALAAGDRVARASESVARRARARLRRRATLSNRKRWPASAVVEPARVLAERREALVAGGEADAGADRGDVVEVAPEPLELEQERAGAARPRGRAAGRASCSAACA